MRKAIAIPYVIALILGVVIIALVGYWIASQGGKSVGTGYTAQCYGKQVSFCTYWRNSAFNVEPKGFTWDANCGEPKLIGFPEGKCMAEIFSCSFDSKQDCSGSPNQKINYGRNIADGRYICCSE